MQNPDVLRLALGVREGIVNISVAGDAEQVRESQLQSMQSETMDESSVTHDETTAQLHEASIQVESELASPMSEFSRPDSSVESEGDETGKDAGGDAPEVCIALLCMSATKHLTALPCIYVYTYIYVYIYNVYACNTVQHACMY